VNLNSGIGEKIAKAPVPNSKNLSPKQSFGAREKRGQKIEFTAWPLSTNKDRLLPPKKESSIPYVALYETVSEQKQIDLGDISFKTLPSTLKKIDIMSSDFEKEKSQSPVEEGLAPKRGGFLWPGNSTLKWPSFSKL